jgi:serine/threonine protein kinase
MCVRDRGVLAQVNIIRELRHPYIVRYFDRIIDKHTTKLYMVTEFCENGDLGALIKRHQREGCVPVAQSWCSVCRCFWRQLVAQPLACRRSCRWVLPWDVSTATAHRIRL